MNAIKHSVILSSTFVLSLSVALWGTAPAPLAQSPSTTPITAPTGASIDAYKKDVEQFGALLEKLIKSKKDFNDIKKTYSDKLLEARQALVQARNLLIDILKQPNAADAQKITEQITSNLQKVKTIVDSYQNDLAKQCDTLSGDTQKLLTDLPAQMKALQEKGIALHIIEEPIKKAQATLPSEVKTVTPPIKTEPVSWWKQWWNKATNWITSWWNKPNQDEKKKPNEPLNVTQPAQSAVSAQIGTASPVSATKLHADIEEMSQKFDAQETIIKQKMSAIQETFKQITNSHPLFKNNFEQKLTDSIQTAKKEDALWKQVAVYLFKKTLDGVEYVAHRLKELLGAVYNYFFASHVHTFIKDVKEKMKEDTKPIKTPPSKAISTPTSDQAATPIMPVPTASTPPTLTLPPPLPAQVPQQPTTTATPVIPPPPPAPNTLPLPPPL